MARKRAAFAASEKEKRTNQEILVSKKAEPSPVSDEKEVIVQKKFKHYIPLVKANSEEQTVTGIVLQPETVDAQGDIISKEVIRKAAHNFMASFNKKTKLGFMHKVFNKNFQLYQSYIAPQSLVLNNQLIKEGTWLMVIKVVDAKVWKMVKEGKIKGFSIGGKAKVKELKAA